MVSHPLRKILVIQTASIGDVILATPVIERLHEVYPDSTIDFLLKKGIEGVFEGHPFIRRLWLWDKQKNKYRNYVRLIRQIRNERYDLIINVQRFASSGLLTTLSKARIKIGFDKNPFSLAFDHKVPHIIGTESNPVHESERNMALIGKIAPVINPRMKLYPSSHDYQAIEHLALGNYICVAPASLWFTKQFPEERWLEFIRGVDASTKIYLLGSKADNALCNRLIINSGRKNILNLAGGLTFLQSAGLMANARMSYVNDSAPMHLASAVDGQVAAIFCSTVPYFGFGPRSKKSFIIESQEVIPCRPCGLHGKKACPEKHFKCALTIKTDQLLNLPGVKKSDS